MSTKDENVCLEQRLSDVSDMSHETCSTTLTCDETQMTIASENQSQNIRVVARIRPLSSKEQNENSKSILITNNEENSVQVDRNKRFVFDKVFNDSSTQEEVYEQTAGDMIQNHLFKGFNVTVLAYGQTGSGKTHTVFGANGNNFTSKLDEETDGIIPRAVHELFQMVKDTPQGDNRIKIDMSFLEIYNEVAKDLLSNDISANDLSIREGSDGVYVKNLSRHSVISPQEVAALMVSAGEKRSVASTLMNAVSSRSHAICTLYVTISPLSSEDEPGEQISAKLTLVDLAGSERVKKTGAAGMRLKEGININKGLFVLGQVVSALSELGQQVGSSDSSTSIHVNYRDSKLTRLLQDSLGGNSKTVMVACVSPADSNVDETVNTLRYAERTRSIKNSAVRNFVETSMSTAEAAALRKENQILKMKLSEAQVKLSKLMSGNLLNGSAAPKFLKDQINGLGVRELDVVTKLMVRCTAMEEKLRQYEQRSKAMAEESLDASRRADEWQQRCDNFLQFIEESGLSLPESFEQSDDISANLVESLREELRNANEKLFQAGVDAEVSRATAAAVLSGKGDLDVAETIAMAPTDTNEIEHIEESDFSISAELHAMGESIEQKELLYQSANQEHECLEAVRVHFESALEALQDEVEALSTEKEQLMLRMQNESFPKNDAKVRVLKQRIGTLEARLKELKQKAADHTKALRLREQAESKVKKLEVEIKEDKKKRAALQRKLKEECVERRNEQKEARNNATKFLRDSNRIKHELAKVKESAAKQEAVLKRKVELASQKNQRLEESNRKRIRPYSSNSSIEITSQRQGEIDAWVEREFNDNLKVNPSKSMNLHFFQQLRVNEYKYVCQSFFQKSMGMLRDQMKTQLPPKKKKKKPETHEIITVETEAFIDETNEDDGVIDDSDNDSDWSPDTPAPTRKKIRKEEREEDIQIEDEKFIDEEKTDHYKKMTVNQLRELLRQSGLTVSGKKADLIKRLQYSARAKKALISPSCSDEIKKPKSVVKEKNSQSTGGSSKISSGVSKNINEQDVQNSVRKSVRKRPVSRPGSDSATSKRLKICQETISSSLRKRSPVASSSSKIVSSRSRISPSSAIKPKKTPPSQIQTRSSRRISPSSANSSSSTRSTRSRTQRVKVQAIDSSTNESKSNITNNKVTTQANDISAKENKSSITNKATLQKTDSNYRPRHLASRKRSDPLSTITNSAKKRKFDRRASMKKSVNNALLQLEQQLEVL